MRDRTRATNSFRPIWTSGQWIIPVLNDESGRMNLRAQRRKITGPFYRGIFPRLSASVNVPSDRSE